MAQPRKMRVSQLAYELTRRGYGNVPTARQLYYQATDGVFPAEPIGTIWHIDEDRIDAIARSIGLTKIGARIAA